MSKAHRLVVVSARLDLEQINLFAALDYAHTTADFPFGQRLAKLLETLGLV